MSLPTSAVWIVISVGCLAMMWRLTSIRSTEDVELEIMRHWLDEIHMTKYAAALEAAGVNSMEKVAKLSFEMTGALSALTSIEQTTLRSAAKVYVNTAILKQWLYENDVQLDTESLRDASPGISCLARLASLSPTELGKLADWEQRGEEYGRLETGLRDLPPDHMADVMADLWQRSEARTKQATHSSGWLAVLFVLTVMLPMGLLNVNYMGLLAEPLRVKRSIIDFVTRRYLAVQFCKVFWEWDDPQEVGTPVSFKIKFYQRNGRGYSVTSHDHLLVEVLPADGSGGRIDASVCLGGKTPANANTATVVFTVRRAADYRVAIMVQAKHIRGSPFLKRFLPGDLNTGMTGFVNHVSMVVCTRALSHQLLLEPRDRYGNLCHYDPAADSATNYQLSVRQSGNEQAWNPHLSVVYDKSTKRINLNFQIDCQGCYAARATYGGVKLKHGDFTILVLDESETETVTKMVAKKSHTVYFEAKLLCSNTYNKQPSKTKKVYCYISPKQLTIKEFYLKIFPVRLFTFRVCPSTKLQLEACEDEAELQLMVIDDGCQPPVKLAIRDRNIMAASFSKYLLKNIGGSETFKDKQDFFYHEVRSLHCKRYHNPLSIRVQRQNILEASMKATKHFSLSDWCRNFEIHFIGEEGLDWGGLRREWFEMLCSELFDATGCGLFIQFNTDTQALVHPNARRDAELKLKYFEFAGRIVGKCLYESALGATYRQLVKARFTRSFLAQLIGLRVNYRYFEQDDPELYISKIKYIEENDVDHMELTFTEEEFKDGRLERVCELVADGARVAVTNANKLLYLDLLAQRRLASSVHTEIEAFLRGLNEFIPDALLSIFDENELELLMCGAGDYSITDFKKNHVICGSSPEFQKVVEWFWTVVSGFTRQEMARLLQFTTGCSQLPSAGFAELCPKLQITAVPMYNRLPTAHTCFNQLCLPDYDSMESLRHSLKVAINEGYQGFGMV